MMMRRVMMMNGYWEGSMAWTGLHMSWTRGGLEKATGGVNDIIKVSSYCEGVAWERSGEGEMLGLCCCPQTEASTWCQWWISDTGEWAQPLQPTCILHIQTLGFQKTRDNLHWGEFSGLQKPLMSENGHKYGCKVGGEKSQSFWSISTHVLSMEKIVYFLSHLAPIFFLFVVAVHGVLYREWCLAHPAVTHLVLQLVLSNIGFGRRKCFNVLLSSLLYFTTLHFATERHFSWRWQATVWDENPLLVSGKCFNYFPLVTLMNICFMVVTVSV